MEKLPKVNSFSKTNTFRQLFVFSRKTTINKIPQKFQEMGKPIKLDFLKKIEEAEKADLVQQTITSQENKPVLTWRTKIHF
jgi:hypothetical protein